ncbi:hypothetical protein SAMN05216516_103286 [Izhakiella capsodis]|uniref:Uncharacterized protein n=1 Tax=Izhakiella capsodis TaxID=1367852 RepID=A0A1I4X3I9_9GAMM|nr:hypothetical protein SAMN05216516_103286 [Izhakiella capsodis]
MRGVKLHPAKSIALITPESGECVAHRSLLFQSDLFRSRNMPEIFLPVPLVDRHEAISRYRSINNGAHSLIRWDSLMVEKV